MLPRGQHCKGCLPETVFKQVNQAFHDVLTTEPRLFLVLVWKGAGCYDPRGKGGLGFPLEEGFLLIIPVHHRCIRKHRKLAPLVVDPGFPDRGRQPQVGAPTYYLAKFFPKNHMKTRNFSCVTARGIPTAV